MALYAIFHSRDLSGALVEACGDRAVIHLDGRNTDANLRAIAADECKKRGFEAWHIARGARLLDAKRVTRVFSVAGVTDLQTASARAGSH